MKTCPYCGSEVKREKEVYYCDFCVMNIAIDKVCESGERLKVRVNDFVIENHVYRTTPELMLFSTYELLYLLKYIRAERTSIYENMHIINNAESETNEFEEVAKQVGSMYSDLTRKMFVLENILRERLGYVPTKITERLLVKYLQNIEKDKKKPMIIRQKKEKERC